MATQNFKSTPPGFLKRQYVDSMKDVLITTGINNHIACKVSCKIQVLGRVR